ncbi:MAG TPA: hypothetical protein VIG88_13340 [Lysobacter sp.]
MAADAGTIGFLLDPLGHRRAAYSARRMFGGRCLYRAGVPVALVRGDLLFMQDTPAGRVALHPLATPAFGPSYPGAKPHLRLAPDLRDDVDRLALVLDATADALSPPRPRKPRPAALTGDCTPTSGKASRTRAATAAVRASRDAPAAVVDAPRRQRTTSRAATGTAATKTAPAHARPLKLPR